ncbi:FliG C-terminal domain-containing protein [Lachnospiraceae bacterium 62-35]
MEKLLDNMRLDAAARLRGEKKGWEQLEEAAETVMALSGLMRKEGLLALEEAAEGIESDFLKHLILLMVDGVDPKIITEIAANEYWVNMPDGVEAMIDYMYLRGIIGIQMGEDEKILMEILQSLMPREQRKNYQMRMNERKEKQEQLYKKETGEKFSRLCPSFADGDLLKALYELEEKINDFPPLCVQRLVRDVDSYDLAACVYAFDEKARWKILNNLSQRFADVIMEAAVYRPPASEKEVSDSVSKVLSMIRILQERGELVHESDGE